MTLPGVEVHRSSLPSDWPDEHADLIVLAEVGYNLDQHDLERALDHAVRRLTPGGIVIAAHWRHDAPDYPLTGDRVHQIIRATRGLEPLAGYHDADFFC